MEIKRIIIIMSIIAFILCLIPLPTRLKDACSIEYNAILYKYIKIHRLNENSKTGYEDGWELSILGRMVGGKINIHNEIIFNNNVITLEAIESTITSEGATFKIVNNTDENYIYGTPYKIEILESGTWQEVNTLNDEPLVWNAIGYSLESREEKTIIINWSFGYGSLKSGKYRLVKSDLHKINSPDSEPYSICAEFSI